MKTGIKPSFIFIFFILFGVPVYATDMFDKQDTPCNSIKYFYKKGCPHCQAAGKFLTNLEKKQPHLNIARYDIYDPELGHPEFVKIIELYGINQPGVPLFLVCGQLIIGFDSPDTTGNQIVSLLSTGEKQTQGNNRPAEIDLPYFGTLDVNKYSLPVFTIIIGLVDGFNQCAMWVLLFLLSLLINLRNRLRILAVAGTFVLVSGAVYFAFMAAWLNLFLIIGWSRVFQLVIGVIALLIGTIHIKDFFAFKQGLTLSIPEKSKPGLYAGVRNVIYAESLIMSLVAIVILAVIVNAIELLCTAGLPALYTQILVLQSLSKIQYYAYLVLYNLAYIFDDALMVAVVVYTLSRTKLQEKTGKFLKLISGAIITILGILLIFFPDILV